MPMILTKRRVKVNMSGPDCIELLIFDVRYQTRKIVLNHTSKHRDAQRSIFDEPRHV